jgi:hypothetical protein
MTNLVVLIACMSLVESGGNADAWNKRECAIGVLQIRRQVVADINRHYHVAFTLKDYRNPGLSAWAVLAYAHIYHARTPEQISRLWNGGPTWRKKKSTVSYWTSVLDKTKRVRV